MARRSVLKEKYLDAAQYDYVYGLYTLDELEAKYPVSRKTLDNWSKEYEWGDERKRRIKNRMQIISELELLVLSQLRSIRKDCDENKAISQSRFYSIKSLTGLYLETLKVKEKMQEPDAPSDDDAKKDGGLSDETIKSIERELKL